MRIAGRAGRRRRALRPAGRHRRLTPTAPRRAAHARRPGSWTRPTSPPSAACWPPTRSRPACSPAGSRPPGTSASRSARRCGASAPGRSLDAVCLAGANLIPFARPGRRARRRGGLRRPGPAGRPAVLAPSSGRPARCAAVGAARAALGAGPRPPAAAAAAGHRRARRRCRRAPGAPGAPDELETLLPAAIAMFTEEVGVSPLRADGGAGYRARVAELVRAGQSLAWIEDGEVRLQGRDRCGLPRGLPGPGRLGGARRTAAGASARPGPPPSSSTPARRSPRWSASTSTTSTPRPAPPTAGRLPRGRPLRQRAVLTRAARCGTRPTCAVRQGWNARAGDGGGVRSASAAVADRAAARRARC